MGYSRNNNVPGDMELRPVRVRCLMECEKRKSYTSSRTADALRSARDVSSTKNMSDSGTTTPDSMPMAARRRVAIGGLRPV